jgi:archaellum component FlaC
MNIDERLERLTERHEALTQSIELMHRDWEDRWANIATAIQQDAENIRALARIAEIHERRLSDLEGPSQAA